MAFLDIWHMRHLTGAHLTRFDVFVVMSFGLQFLNFIFFQEYVTAISFPGSMVSG
jgi:hypothetical protein